MKKIIQKLSSGLMEMTLPQKAQAHYEAGRFKEAGDTYKALLKQANDAGYRQRLADCYLQRAKAMAEKGLFKEACVLWENHAEYGEAPQKARDAYVMWLLAGKNLRKAQSILSDFDARQWDDAYPELAAMLGAWLASGSSDVLALLPAESALVRHWHTMREALEAYRIGEPARCEQALKTLPFRSAFRDLRTILKAQMLDVARGDQASELLSKVPATSPYRPLADALMAYRQRGAAFVDAVSLLDGPQRRIVAQARGLTGKRLNLLETLVQKTQTLNDRMRFNLVLNYRSEFGDAAARAYCLTVAAHDQKRFKDYAEHFAIKDAFEENRLQALLCEQDRNSYDAAFFWNRCIDILKRDRPVSDRKIALILRHRAKTAPYEQAATLLTDSLTYDPDDRETYLDLLRIHEEHRPNPSAYHDWLERALTQFPADPDLLVRAAKSAAARKAFKKAATYAKTLLSIDPVNTLAKQLLFDNHMAHARRLLKTGKNHLVEKEIQAAEQLTVDKTLRLQASLLRDFHLYLTDDKPLGVQQVVDTLTKLNTNPVAMQFQVQMEAGLLALPTSALTRALPAFKDYLLSAAELRHLIASIKLYDQQLDDRSLLFAAIDKVKAALKKSVQWLLDHEALLLAWCECLESIGHFELLKHCAKLANNRWREPIWIYYLRVGECRGDPGNLDFMSLMGLQSAAEDARAANDRKTEALILRLLERAQLAASPFAFEDDIDSFDDATSDDRIDDLFRDVPDSIFERIDAKALELMKKIDPKKFSAKMMTQYGYRLDPGHLSALLSDEEFLLALLYLSAAEQLDIDIGVGFDDVVARFDNSPPQMTIPFT